jgi:hypothetical protein
VDSVRKDVQSSIHQPFLQKANQAAKLLGHDLPMLNAVKAYAYLGLKDTNSGATELRQYLRKESSGAQLDKARAIRANIDW